ncbi:hypothetical protein RJ639_036949 [Escallonia herrerae]|uniref:F-box/LRR-repeat protein 15/At3g58940/PEG3-like LRR domain-containing protein n=1 Tax=Escallonia herrerae TaxID=1293975 RepID=A0AA88WQ16_9ASTE|nr:hypothetical protein RJ639_036949 [Escallonia herrerae]
MILSVKSNQYASTVNELLLLHNGPILKFVLETPEKELTHLKLFDCGFDPPLTCKGFPNLIVLELWCVLTKQGKFCTSVSSCPLLETLTLESCFEGAPSFGFCAPSLKKFSIDMRVKVENATMSNIIKVLDDLPRIEELCVGNNILKYLAAGCIPETLPTTLTYLKNLAISYIHMNNLAEVRCVDITMAISETIPESGSVHPSGGTVYATLYVAPAHGSVGLGERSEKFNGKDFKRWQQKMLFYLTTLNLARFLQEDAPDLGENLDRQTVATVDAWKHLDFLCKNYILNGLDNALYNVYSPMVNAKALWESLERKYKTEDAGSKKFVVGKFLDFKMVDSKTVISQVQEFQLILHDIHAEGMHKRKEMKLEDLIVRLRIEEDNRQSEKKAGNYHQEAKANVVEQEIVMEPLVEDWEEGTEGCILSELRIVKFRGVRGGHHVGLGECDGAYEVSTCRLSFT